MSQATLSHNNPASNFTLKNALPWLRTLIDMLLVCGGLFALLPLPVVFRFPSTWPLAVFQAGCLASVLAGATLIVSTARTNRLQQRKMAFSCIATVMLFMAGLSVFVSQALPNTECMSAVSLMTMCDAVWGCSCCGLISIEDRIVKKQRLRCSFDLKLGFVQTVRRLIMIAMGAFFSLDFIFLPAWILIQLTTDSQDLPQALAKTQTVAPPGVAAAIAVVGIALWVWLSKCGLAISLWKILVRYHSPNVKCPKSFINKQTPQWMEHFLLFLTIGVVGVIATVVAHNTSDPQLQSAPWILAAMIGCTAFGYWKILQKERSSILEPA